MLFMEECIMKLPTNQCLYVPYDYDLKGYDEETYEDIPPSFCIPEDQIATECGSI